MTIIIGKILSLSSLVTKSIKLKTKNIEPSFISAFSFFLNHLRITVIYKYTKLNSKMICADKNKKPH